MPPPVFLRNFWIEELPDHVRLAPMSMVALLCNFVLFCVCGGQAHVVVSRKISSSPAHRGCFLEGPFIITQPLYVCGGGIIMQDKVLFSFLFAIYNYIF